jgi:uncharacterized protein (TIGR03000 family)
MGGGFGWGWGGPGWGWGFDSPGYFADSGFSPGYDNGQRISAYQDPAAPPPVPQNTALIRVLVPDDAKIWFNQAETTQTGPVRVFNTPQLEPGRNYTYDVRAQWRSGDHEVNQNRQASFHSGDAVTVSFR